MPSPSALDAGIRRPPVSDPLPLLYRLLRPPVRRLLERQFDLVVEGAHHLPARGPYIVAANHHNYLDGIVLAAAVGPPISFLVMPRVWRATPLHPLFHRHIGSIPLEVERAGVVVGGEPRRAASRPLHPLGALRRALAALDAGRVVGIFPEGPFSMRGQLEAGLHGVALLALRSGAPVIAAAIRGTYQALVGRRFYVPRRYPLHVRFGAPRTFAGVNGDGRRRARAVVTDRIMADIAHLLG
jgi:1-acyl-sn-glycerol-3-phosphate acyltransferase